MGMVKAVLPYRWALLNKAIPSLFSSPGTLLYIGASKVRFDCGEQFHQAGFSITLVEIWESNVAFYRNHPWVDHTICGDVRHIDLLNLPCPYYDVTFWWHGPEHIEKAKLPSTLAKLERITNGVIVLSSPWGKSKQGPSSGNPYEQHCSTLYQQDFEYLGYHTIVGGRKNAQSGSVLIAWKHLSKNDRWTRQEIS